MPSESSSPTSGHGRVDPMQAFGELRPWCELEPGANPTEILASNLGTLGLGTPREIGTSSLVLKAPPTEDARAITLISSHNLSRLTTLPASPGPQGDVTLRGPGVGSRAASLMAAGLGLGSEAASNLAVTILSVGPGDSLAALATEEHVGRPDLLLFTDAVAWHGERPTITVGSRGRVGVTLTVSAPARVNDVAYGGATLNPLNRLIELLALLRGERGRIGLPGFYERAEPPARGSLAEAGSDDWLTTIGASRPSGSLSGLERATQWPVMSVLDVRSDGDVVSSPQSASAHVVFSLVPHQRPVDIERSMRSWLTEHTPPSLASSIRITQSARPYRVDTESSPARALATAIRRVHGAPPLAVPAGGTIGAGEVEYRFDAPVLFAGLIGPNERYGTTEETVDASRFAQGVDVMRTFGQFLGRAGTSR